LLDTFSRQAGDVGDLQGSGRVLNPFQEWLDERRGDAGSEGGFGMLPAGAFSICRVDRDVFNENPVAAFFFRLQVNRSAEVLVGAAAGEQRGTGREACLWVGLR